MQIRLSVPEILHAKVARDLGDLPVITLYNLKLEIVLLNIDILNLLEKTGHSQELRLGRIVSLGNYNIKCIWNIILNFALVLKLWGFSSLDTEPMAMRNIRWCIQEQLDQASGMRSWEWHVCSSLARDISSQNGKSDLEIQSSVFFYLFVFRSSFR